MLYEVISKSFSDNQVNIESISNQWLTITGEKQVISLGCGFDTGFFVYASKNLLDSTVYYEIDFDGVVFRKAQMIRENEDLKKYVKVKLEKKSLILQGDLTPSKDLPYQINAQNYKLFDVDLRDTRTVFNRLAEVGKTDLNKPTIFLAECVLTYMDAIVKLH